MLARPVVFSLFCLQAGLATPGLPVAAQPRVVQGPMGEPLPSLAGGVAAAVNGRPQARQAARPRQNRQTLNTSCNDALSLPLDIKNQKTKKKIIFWKNKSENDTPPLPGKRRGIRMGSRPSRSMDGCHHLHTRYISTFLLTYPPYPTRERGRERHAHIGTSQDGCICSR